MKKYFQQITYICCDLKGSLFFKLKYFFDKLLRLIVLIVNKVSYLNITLPYLFKKDYILSNNTGKRLIKHHSDHDYIVNSHTEESLKEYFFVEDWIFIDIGAHIWKWDVYVWKLNNKNKVFAIEPNPDTFAYLKKNIELNKLDKQIIPINYWISDKIWNLYFKCEEEQSATSKILETLENEDPSIINIPVISIDTLIEQQNMKVEAIQLIKIDTEGHEMKVFKGMKNFLQISHKVKIICEILEGQRDRDAIFSFMKKNGFSYKLLPTWCDYLFFKENLNGV